MRSITHLIVLGFLFLNCGLPASAQSQTNNDQSELLRQLLATPAPLPLKSNERPVSLIERPPEFFAKANRPADEAAIEDLQMYWSRWAAIGGDNSPSEVVQRRLLEACAADPEALTGYLALLSSTEANAKLVKRVFDQGGTDLNEEWRAAVREWLLFNSKYFLGELTAQASKAKDVEKEGEVKAAKAVIALARVDWSSAEPLLKRLASSAQPRSSALAISLIYRHAIDEKDSGVEERSRAQLRDIAGDRSSPALARITSIEALSDSEWSGRDDWYLSMFQDETLLDPQEGEGSGSPLASLAAKDPEKWIPQLAKLVESKDVVVRSAAASCLMSFANTESSKTAFKPLLPWLSDPSWVKDQSDLRTRLIQSLGLIDLPESVPGLISLVAGENESSTDRAFAGETLAKYKDPRAVAALKKALLAEKSPYYRLRLIKGLMASGGISEIEQAEAIEALAEKLISPGGREDLSRYRGENDEPYPLQASIGLFLSQGDNATNSLVQAVLTRADDLRKANPALSVALLEIVHQWQGSQVDRDMIHRLAAGTADAKLIVRMLERRADLRERLRDEVQGLVNVEGVAQGLGAVLLEDNDLSINLLGSEKPAAQTAVLLAARLTHTKLPPGAVIPLLKNQDQLLAAAAERYLLAEDSKEAREALWARHPDDSFVTGWREKFDFLGSESDSFDKAEDTLRSEFGKAGSPVETYALLGRGEDYRMILRVYPDRAVYFKSNDASRYTERVITKEELSTFKEFVRTNELMDLGAQFSYCHHNCVTSEFLMLAKEKGRRVFHFGNPVFWSKVIQNFIGLNSGDNLTTHYKFENDIKGMEVLYRDDRQVVQDVWQKGAEVRVCVQRAEAPEEASTELPEAADSSDDEEDENALIESLRKERALARARFSWRLLKNGKADELATVPAGFSAPDENRFPLRDEELRSYGNERTGKFISEDSIVFAAGSDGLWRQSAGQKPVRISNEEGWYTDPIVTADGKWVAVARTSGTPREPDYIARFNLQTGREIRVNIPAADQIMPIAYLPSHKKVLISRSARADVRPGKPKGPERPEYYLLDAATGESRLVTGEFEPLHQEGKRFLQSTGKLNEFWAAMPDRTKGQTRIGRYNTRDFTFQQVMTVPHIVFDSMQMWVDEAGAKVYLVYKGDLLSLPLRSSQ